MPSNSKHAIAKRALFPWLEKYCQKNTTFRRDLFILFKQKKYRNIGNNIKKEYFKAHKKKDKEEAAKETNFLDNSQHVLDVMKNLERCDFKNDDSTPKNSKRSFGKLESSVDTSDGQISNKKGKKNSHEPSGDGFDEDEMTSFLDQEDDNAMKRFSAEEEGEEVEDEDEQFVQETMYDLSGDEEEEGLNYGDFFKA